MLRAGEYGLSCSVYVVFAHEYESDLEIIIQLLFLRHYSTYVYEVVLIEEAVLFFLSLCCR